MNDTFLSSFVLSSTWENIVKRYSVVDVHTFEPVGPWKTKSHGELVVLAGIPWHTLSREFFNYDQEELRRIPIDIRGQRFYTVRGLPKGMQGGNEFHRIREEIVIGLEGESYWHLTDLSGSTSGIPMKPGTGIWIRPGIMHSYSARTENAGHLVICNTLFIPEDPRTHDTYSMEEFLRLKAEQKP